MTIAPDALFEQNAFKYESKRTQEQSPSLNQAQRIEGTRGDGGPGRIRTYDQAIMSRLRYRCATGPELPDIILQCIISAMTGSPNCIICGRPLTGKQTKFCSRSCKNKDLQSYDAQQQRGLARKLELVKAAGSCCSRCGYRGNLAALTFHHTDPSQKEFKLDMRSLSNRKLNYVLRELDKCTLVCANCHAELHNPHLDLGQLLGSGAANT